MAAFFHPTLVWDSARVEPNVGMKFGIRKLESWGYQMVKIMTLTFFVLIQYRLVAGRRTRYYKYTTLCLIKRAQLWNGIAGNDMDRFWWYLAEIFRRLQNRVCMFQCLCRFACYHVIVSQTARKLRVHAVHFSQLLIAPFLIALETQIFVHYLWNWWSTDPPPHVKFLWLFGGSEVCLPDSATATQLCQRFHQYRYAQYSVCRCLDACRLFRTSPATCWCCSSSNLWSETLL